MLNETIKTLLIDLKFIQIFYALFIHEIFSHDLLPILFTFDFLLNFHDFIDNHSLFLLLLWVTVL